MDDPSVQHSYLQEVDLTDRQMEVLRLKADRRTNAEIAKKLVITVTTVKWHVRQIYNKLGVNNRAEAIASARHLGLLEKRSKRRKGALHNFPTPLTHFVGRKHDILKVSASLTDPDTRLLTLLGPGGIGKTRLAMQVTKSLEADFPDGICWVPFSALDQAELVFTTIDEYIAENIYTAFGLTRQGKQEYTQLLESHLKKRQALIVLDSFESLLSGKSFISDLLTNTADCKFLITSRERLNLPGEMLYPVQGLAQTPVSDDITSPTDAVRLFLQEANRVSRSDLDHPDHLPSIQHICTRLEGMPLAITLAAEWSRMLPVEVIEQELEHGLEFLDTGSTSIRSVFDRSWRQLTNQQQAAFARLAVFQRGFTREAAREVAGADLATLSALFDKSLIQQMDEGRYTFHDLLRQYAAEHLEKHGDWDATRDAHCAYFAAQLSNQETAIISGDHSKILPDLDNIRSAWRWAVKRRRFSDLNLMVFPLDWFYNLRALYSEATAVMGLAVDELQMENPKGLQGTVYAKVLIQYGLEQTWVHGADQNAESIHEGIKILRNLNRRKDLAWPLILAVLMGLFRNDPQTRENYCLDSLAIFEEMEDSHGIAFCLTVLSAHYRQQNKFSNAKQSIERGLAISHSIKDQEGIAHAFRNFGHLYFHFGDFENASIYYCEEARLWGELSLPRLKNQALQSLANTALAAGQLNEAEHGYLESLAEFERLDDLGNSLNNLFSLTEIALRRKNPKEAIDLLRDAQSVMEKRQDIEEQVRWWLLSGQASLQQGKIESAHLAFCRALKYTTRVSNKSITEIFLGFAYYYHQRSDQKTAALLFGFAQAQAGLSVALVRSHMDPLHSSLAATLDEKALNGLLEEGAALDEQELIKRLLADCG